ncbi:hypothetical protein ELG78_09165 [Rhizobium leguminosarum]|uniref:hypothetical protein n=1 Tax=Rhizobium leguminosarum TaxID=384 RepID=UPI00102F3A6A|nr:hypothetical protein [Rhizobium leguminosarum]TBG37138.1 hypothetical protein ELG78_09165 [Rhizobium leguminosarum]
MKFQTVQVVTADELLNHIGQVIEANHTVNKNGGKRGGVMKTARQYGIRPQELSNTINRSLTPPKRVLEAENLEKQVFYVRKGSKSDE